MDCRHRNLSLTVHMPAVMFFCERKGECCPSHWLRGTLSQPSHNEHPVDTNKHKSSKLHTRFLRSGNRDRHELLYELKEQCLHPVAKSTARSTMRNKMWQPGQEPGCDAFFAPSTCMSVRRTRYVLTCILNVGSEQLICAKNVSHLAT